MENKNIELTKMTEADFQQISPILFSEFDDFWTHAILLQEIKSKNSYFICVKIENEIVGFGGIKIILGEADLMNLVIKKSHRNNGLGKIVLQTLISYCKNNQIKSITLEVNEYNTPALALYQKLGFQTIGSRTKYYGTEKALLMKWLVRDGSQITKNG